MSRLDALTAGAVKDRKSTRLNSSHTVIYTLSLHDALPISKVKGSMPVAPFRCRQRPVRPCQHVTAGCADCRGSERSEEHTSELQSHRDLHSFPTRRSSDLEGERIHAGCSLSVPPAACAAMPACHGWMR